MTDKDKLPVAAIPYEVYREQEANAQRDLARELKMDETEPGGRYTLNGILVDCDGKAIKDHGDVKEGTPVAPAQTGAAAAQLTKDDVKNMTDEEMRSRLVSHGVSVSESTTKEQMRKLLSEPGA